MKTFLLIGAIFTFFGVVLGAFGAHALKDKLSPQALNTFEIGVRYQIIHALGLMILGLILFHYYHVSFILAGIFFVAGIVLFSGSLFALAITSVKFFAFLTPIGGTFFIIGWISIILGLCKI